MSAVSRVSCVECADCCLLIGFTTLAARSRSPGPRASDRPIATNLPETALLQDRRQAQDAHGYRLPCSSQLALARSWCRLLHHLRYAPRSIVRLQL